MINRKKPFFYICQVSEQAIKLLKARPTGTGGRPEFLAVESERFASPLNDQQICEKLTQLLKKIGYNHEQVVFCLPRGVATARYLKVPAQAYDEIEKIVGLQASRLIPYAAEELNTGFQVIQTDKEGFSELTAVIVLKGVIQRYLNYFEPVKPSGFSVALSSFGLCNLYGFFFRADNACVLLVDIDAYSVELAVIKSRKLLFSRAVKIAKSVSLEETIGDEVAKTTDAYLKEVAGKGAPEKIVVLSSHAQHRGVADALAGKFKIPVEHLSYGNDRCFLGPVSNALGASALSYTSVVGVGLEEVPAYANLLPLALKQEVMIKAKGKKRLRIGLSLVAIAAIISLAAAINLKNKGDYLEYLKSELGKISQDAKTLEAIEERFQLLAQYSKKRVSSLAVLHTISRTIPENVALLNFSYDDGNELTIRGRAPDLNPVFDFVSALQNTQLLRKFTIKVRYATKKKTQAGEVVDFEISCLKGK